MNVVTVIDPISNKKYDAYFSREVWIATTDYRLDKDRRMQPNGMVEHVTFTLDKMWVPTTKYFGDNIIRGGYPLIIKDKKETYLGLVEQVDIATHDGDRALLNVRLQEVPELKFAERVDEIVTKRG